MSSQQANSRAPAIGGAVADTIVGRGPLTRRYMGETESVRGAPADEEDKILSL